MPTSLSEQATPKSIYSMARGCHFLLSHAELLSPEELKQIQQLKLPNILPFRIKREGEGIRLILSPPGGWFPLIEVDRRANTPNQGLKRIGQLLRSMQDARNRLLDPKFSYFSLADLYLSPSAVAFPLLPQVSSTVSWQRQPMLRKDFWEEWVSFYKLQEELASLGRTLSNQGKWEELSHLFARMSRHQKPKAPPFLSMPKKKNLWLPSLSNTSPIPAPSNFYLAELSEILPTNCQEKTARKALLWDYELWVGRDPAHCELHIDDPSVGRLHAKFERHGSHWTLRDLSSINGTWLNGRRLPREQAVLLPPNCRVAFSRKEFRFRAHITSSYFVPKRRSPASPRPGIM